ncbi:hypothetical protein A3860_31985 [Niastella vici]|uniref:Glycosyltransferase RgtA/B/C/D-like domain-containing protein n=1 Tax=Niastella vici TaxID=1703345 RepID=A0A1V9FTH7_9BACT|nr:glucosyltransferase domain-containing protein [Niastella vici]OQP61546.1 hypothetical protein A3860_31985 [Niastella vici]
MAGLQRKDLNLLSILFLVTLVIFYPIFTASYLYTDESIQLWAYRPGSGFRMFIDQGRLVTEWLFIWLFGAVKTVAGVTYIRIFSLVGWLVCLPVWYAVLKSLMAKDPAYQYLPFFTCLYLVTSLPFGISIQWASCLELFLAGTSGLVAGFAFYKAILFTDNKFRIAWVPAIIGIAFGIISLFTYQTSAGCFLIPFLFHYISRKDANKDKVIVLGVIGYFLMYVIYFGLYKLSLVIGNVGHNDRTEIHIDLLNKLTFFFSHPLKRSFWFNANIYEFSSVGRALYKIMLIGLMVFAFVRYGREYWKAVKYIVVMLGVFLLSYLPGLIVKENYASNRTMMALDLCVWLVCIEMLLYFIKKKMLLTIGAITVACTLVITAWYNLRYQFLRPITDEYAALNKFFKEHYHPGVKTLHVIKSPIDAFEKKYNIRQSMDEYGVPSTAPYWTMDFLPKQLVFEMTGNRQTGEQLEIKQWDDWETYSKSGETRTDSVLLVNMPEIINAAKPAR